MDFDVKQSLDRLFKICESAEATWSKKHSELSLKDTVLKDICTFINTISIQNAERRFEDFSIIYLESQKIKYSRETFDNLNPPSSFKFLFDVDLQSPRTGKFTLSSTYQSFFAGLGQFYMHSAVDKKEIDREKVIGFIQMLFDNSQVYLSQTVKTNADVDAKQNPESKTDECLDREESSGDQTESEESLEELMEQLNSLIGLSGVKDEVNTLINMLKIKKIREERGFETANISKHLVFLGNPGTGKTTVARLLSKIYKQLGALEKGQLVEVDRGDLVAGFVGQTALKTKEKIVEAMGGILFIDEAYTLAKGGNDFGQEAIDTLLKAMEDNRDSFVVIVAGYPGPMEEFLASNPGLKSRFNKHILFDDYSDKELRLIFDLSCEKLGLSLSTGASEYLDDYLRRLVENKPENFANGREMRNLFETVYSNQNNRLAATADLTDESLNEIVIQDFSNVVR